MNALRKNMSALKQIRKFSTGQVLGNYETLKVVTLAPHVRGVELNRPDKLNTMTPVFWKDMRDCFRDLHQDADCRAIVISGNGRVFTAGLALSPDDNPLFATIMSDMDTARKGKLMYKVIREYQDSFTAIEKCEKPVIAAVHSACVGGGTNMICAADIRLCTSDAWFQIKETAIGMAADVGVLQRMSKVIGSDSLVRELAFTARKMHADEAKERGFVNRVFADKNTMMDAAIDIGKQIASHSPVAVVGTKLNLNFSRDHTVDESLEFAARINALNLLSTDLVKAITAQMQKSKAEFDNY